MQHRFKLRQAFVKFYVKRLRLPPKNTGGGIEFRSPLVYLHLKALD